MAASRSLAKRFQATLNLPQTGFPMRYDPLTVSAELQQRCTDGLYAWQERQSRQHRFVLHDGPPYANGRPHLGHALNKILKDFVVRYKLMCGHRISMIPGWDCHGLPIELKALERLKGESRAHLSAPEVRSLARALALEAINMQRDEFRSWNLLGDWANPYRTLDPSYEVAQLDVFANMVKSGLIYRDFKPVYWSPSSRTALAEAELEYMDNHRSDAIYVRLPVTTGRTNLALLVWTTTPWTLPANQAVAINRNIAYCIVQTADGQHLVVAKALVDTLAKDLDMPLQIVSDITIDELLALRYRHPLWDDSEHAALPVLEGAHVSDTTGTGLVHTAPAHGLDDYKLCRENGINISTVYVDDLGNYTTAAGSLLQGQNVLGHANATVIAEMIRRGLLVKHAPYLHRYPYDWRTKKPVILRATAQWFCSLRSLSGQAVDALTSRAWGVPIPVFYHIPTDKPVLTPESIMHVKDMFAKHGGSDAWWTLPLSELLPPSLRPEAHNYRKGDDTMDVWFDSGSSWAALRERLGSSEQPFAIDVYLEGSDQHRGWFQSSLLTSVATQGSAPYRDLITHGFVLDAEGRKMSKSLGNVIEPNTVVLGGKDKKKQPPYGVDVMRLWVASTEYVNDVTIGPHVLEKVGENFRKLRNTMRFMLGNLNDFRLEDHSVQLADLEPVDRYMLHLLNRYIDLVTQAFDAYTYNRVYMESVAFASSRITKDRLYAEASTSRTRRSVQTVLFHILHTLTRVAAVLTPATAESVYEYYRRCFTLPPPDSIAMHEWPRVNPQWNDDNLAAHMERLQSLRNDALVAIEQERAKGLLKMADQADVVVSFQREHQQPFQESLKMFGANIGLFFGVATFATEETATTESTEQRIRVTLTKNHKCPRCWNYHSTADDTLCSRCDAVVPLEQRPV